MVVSEKIGNVINEIDVILRLNIGENKKDASKLYRNSDNSEKIH